MDTYWARRGTRLHTGVVYRGICYEGEPSAHECATKYRTISGRAMLGNVPNVSAGAGQPILPCESRVSSPTCRFCGWGATRMLGRVQGFHHPSSWVVWECRKCLVQFIDANEHPVDLARFYEDLYATEGPQGHQSEVGLVSSWRWRRQVRMLTTLLPRCRPW